MLHTRAIKRIFFFTLLLPATIQSQAQTYLSEQRSINTIPDTATIQQSIRYSKTIQNANTDSAITLLQAALQNSRTIKYVHGVTSSLFALGNIYSENGMYDKALTAFDEDTIYCRLFPREAPLLPEIYNGIACCYQYLYNYQEAAKYLYKAAYTPGAPSAGFSLGGVYNNFGLMLSRMGQEDEAMTYLDKAEALAGQGKNQDLLLAGILINKGTIYVDRKDWTKGQKYLEAAINIGVKNNFVSIQKTALVNIGNIYLTQGKAEQALPYLLRGYALKGNVNPVYGNANKAMLGAAYYQLHQYKEGKKYLLDALAEAQQLHMGQNLLEINRILSELNAITGDYKQAYGYYTTYTKLKDSLENKDRIKNINQFEIKYRVAEKDKALFQKQLLINAQRNHLENKNIWLISIIGIAVLITVVLLSLYRINRHKQRLQEKQIRILEQEKEISRFNAIMQGEEKERARLARELHDGLGGMLAAIKMNLSTLHNKYAIAGISHQPDINQFTEIEQMLDDVSSEVRKTAHNMMPDVLVRHGIIDALALYIDTINNGNKLYIKFHPTGDWQSLDMTFQLSLYRIMQELIQNTIKHANASNAMVQMNRTGNSLSILIKDNGSGFDIKKSVAGLGLKNIESRVNSFGGKLYIQSAEDKGTAVTITFDLTNKPQ